MAILWHIFLYICLSKVFYVTCHHITMKTNPSLKRWHCYACARQHDRVTCEWSLAIMTCRLSCKLNIAIYHFNIKVYMQRKYNNINKKVFISGYISTICTNPVLSIKCALYFIMKYKNALNILPCHKQPYCTLYGIIY